MANAVYWDTSALLKLYAPEPDSSDYTRLLIQQPEDLAISFLHHVELYFALCGKEDRGEIAAGSAKHLFASFERHVSAGQYFVIPWGDDIARESRRLLDKALAAKPPTMLRSLDGLHFGAVCTAKIQHLVCADLRMRQAAKTVGIGVIEL
jgi:hypothetical protein